jgi:methylglutaconyl-CoA hydratase
MAQAKYESILIEIADRVATVSLNRPDVRNAFNPVMIRELTEAFTVLGSRKDISVVVLRGEGKSFCSGADLGYMKSMASYSFEENEKDSLQLFGMFWALRSCPHPIVGRLHGHVMGGGIGLAALCDIAFAVDETQFCFSEVRLGLAPAVISPYVLERMASSHARRFMLTGEIFSVAQAMASGLVHASGSEEEIDRQLAELVKSMCQNGPEAVRATKALIRSMGEANEWARKREMTTKVISERRVSEEGQEGLRGFLEKRPPKWRPA